MYITNSYNINSKKDNMYYQENSTYMSIKALWPDYILQYYIILLQKVRITLF